MNIDDYKNSNIAWYRQRLKQHDESVQILAAGTEGRRNIRFGVLTDLGITPGCSVLDVGCGLADYYAFLIERGFDVSYTGVDIVPDFIEKGRLKYPGLDLQVRDLLSDPLSSQSYDFVVSTHTFTLRFGDNSNLPLVQSMMKAMFEIARKGVAVDFITKYVDFQEPLLEYHSPEEMFKLAKSLTKRVVLRHDYPLYEFCLYLYPDFKGWRQEESLNTPVDSGA
jgi:SAM-dependent methyltransferase